MHPKNLSITDFDYSLPEEKIAVYPLKKRDESKLLIYKNETISQDIYRNIANNLPENSLLIFNDTKVIKARILFKKITGAVIEIFCLEPYEKINDYALVLAQKKSVRWKCMIGGAGKWKEKFLEKEIRIHDESIIIKAALVQKLTDAYVVELSWNPGNYSFAEIIDHAGETPLPPYIKRKAEESDSETYQTIYSAHEGSVAAPTAGLHFTKEIFSSLKKKNIDTGFVTLHVGAGTFKPVKAASMEGHEMHAEWIDVSTDFIEQLNQNISHQVFCVGTTSVRTVESLYWMGLKTFLNPDIEFEKLKIEQWEVYEKELFSENISAKECLTSLLNYLITRKTNRLFIQTQIIIAPGYSFKIINGMITNFHQPKSTLLLLVAAMIGNKWKEIYEYALTHEFRFLSYGDGCLIFKELS
ncbi:MAG TPA: S-adenosylmethionine:tRNA ribosyltransferase-isomerase [Hanamia sp.]|jgi:S-adenosylmethionine:tRNA ribosyltransferase-isomerase|nr:S-adenosylmethionine:tRNA ribosyltransferase-isomerase [Hanamia sp.]